MCGIAGIISPNPKQEDLEKMLQTQHHRGPDNTGIMIDQGFATLGHNRLSIIDLSLQANQPFEDNMGRFSLTFNGEIYNYLEIKNQLSSLYRFKTSSDTEVLLASYIVWGKNCLEKLNGMFAFAIWDKKNKTLFAARDRFGVKPFYYYHSSETFIFASEIKAVNSFKKDTKPNKKVWANYFIHGSYGMPCETFYKGINQLPGGYYLEYSDSNLQTKRWYDFENRLQKNNHNLGFDEVRDRYFQLLKESISLRFRADVPIGFNISGGVDSSLLLSLVNLFEDKSKISAYTFYTGDSRYDELPWVEQMISTTGNSLKKVLLDSQKANSILNNMSLQQDEPFGGIPTMAYAGIFEQAQKDGIKVLLDGQGMDEQWAGYDYYFKNNADLIQGMGKANPYKKSVLTPELSKFEEAPTYPEPFNSSLLNLQYRDLFFTKLPRALRFNDRISMNFSTELREPFLDYRMVELATALPESFKIKGSIQKYMLREILKKLVPHEISTAPKRPLQTPQREWLAEELQDVVTEKLQALKGSAYSSWFDHQEIDTEWRKYLKGNIDSSFHIWQWINASILLEKIF